MNPIERNVEALDAVEGKTQRFPIDGQPSLYLQVTGKPGDPVKSWVFRYRLPSGTQVNYTIGRWPALSWTQVRKLMITLRAQADKGIKLESPRKAKTSPPAPAAKDDTPTVKEVAEEFYKGHILAKNQPSTQKFQRWALDKYVIPQLGEMKITALTIPVVTKFLDDLASRPVLANRVKALLSKMFNWSGRRAKGVLVGVANPVTGQEHHKETPRERLLSDDEIRKLGDAYRKSREPLQSAALFLLLTGAREGALLNLETGEVSMEEGVIRFPANTPGLKKCRKVYFSRSAAALLEKCPEPVLKRSLWRSWCKLRDKAGLGPKKIPEGTTPRTEDLGVSLHDLRRTFESKAVNMKHDGALIHALTGHSNGRVRDTYQHYADPIMSQLAEDIGETIAGLLAIGVPKTRAKTSGQPGGTPVVLEKPDSERPPAGLLPSPPA